MHTTEFLDNRGVIVIRYSERVDFEEIRRALDELVQLRGFRPGLHLIADFRKCETPLTGDQVRQLAEYAERSDAEWGNSKWVLLASSDVTFGLARMYATLTSSHNVATRVFRNADEVNGWLGLGVSVDEILASSAQLSLTLPPPR